ncbi:MAG: primosomal protein N' [Christensenellaceae bacterium]|nr:primosomal protein N' [Christensenellaceae bacterium]
MVYKVIVDLSNSNIDKFFHYNSNFDIEIGSRVKVPFGNREVEGFVIEKSNEESKLATKQIISTIDPYPVILKEMIELAGFMTKSNIRFIDALRLFIPADFRNNNVKELTRNFIEIKSGLTADDIKVLLGSRVSNAQTLLLERLNCCGAFEKVLLNEGYSQSAINTLLHKGVIEKTGGEVRRIPKSANTESKEILLTSDQLNAINEITNYNNNSAPNSSTVTFLIHGVTGCGKTEIYMSVIERVLAIGKTAIMLVPEISLTHRMLGIFRARFGEQVSILHSGLSKGERFDEWRRLRNGVARVAMGARSAIFAPIMDVGIIIVDEEHDSSYSSDTNPRYFTIDIAQFRARYNNAKVVLGSATPSVESYLKAQNGEYKLITIENRINQKALPIFRIVDMRDEIKDHNKSMFSRVLINSIREVLASKQQAIIFINRRGFASFIRCKACGYVAMCTDCDVSLTYHRQEKHLKCHYCGNTFYALDICPQCKNPALSEGSSGTERVVDELLEMFPDAKILRLDNDTVTAKDSYLKILTDFADGEADILVGTKMVTKGHDFKNVTLVGILDADQSLYFSHYTANEDTFQLITQVAGRAGREEKPGKVIMQTYNPGHEIFEFAKKYDYLGFYERERAIREVTKFPPYTKIIRVLISGQDENLVKQETIKIREDIRRLKDNAQGIILRVQAMSAPIKRLRSNIRYQVIIVLKADCDTILQSIFDCSKASNNKVYVSVEINPKQMQ